MIAKAVKGKGFRGALEYDLTKEKGRPIDTNMAGEGPRELAAEFGEIRKLRPNLGKAVLHVSLSALPGEKLTDAQWRDIASAYLVGMGLEKNQYLVTRHTDTEHEHIHILANRIRFDGSVTSDSLDYKRQEVLMRKIELQYGLERVAPSLESVRRAPTKGEIENHIRTGRESTRQRLQQACDVAVVGSPSFTDYVVRLEKQSVEVIAITQLGGEKLSGLMYRLDGVLMKGSDLGKGYSPAGLVKRGVSYGQSRDAEAVSRCSEREAARVAGGESRERAPGRVPERGGIGGGVGAVGAGDGGAGGRDSGDAGRDRSQEPGSGSELRVPGRAGDAGLERGVQGGGHERGQAGPGGGKAGVEALRPDGGSGGDFSSPRERVVALAGTRADSKQLGREGGGRVPQAGRDRSVEALQRQIGALDCGLGLRFELEVRAADGKVARRAWTQAELEKPVTVAWLKRMNAKGHGVFVRPAGDHGLALVDELKAEGVDRMKRSGLAPAVTLETSPGVYQVWVKLAVSALPADTRHMAARSLAKEFGGADCVLAGQAYGRLAGFTNWQHVRDGRPPYVLAHECSGQVAAQGPGLLVAVGQELEQSASQRERARRLETLRTAPAERLWGHGQPDPLQEYQRQARRLLEQYGAGADLSRVDWMIAQDMAKSGRFTVGQIEQGLREGSPNVDSRKAGHVDDYAYRTAAKAWISPEVQAYRVEQATRAQQRLERGRDGPTLG
jgi:hypothetical protein